MRASGALAWAAGLLPGVAAAADAGPDLGTAVLKMVAALALVLGVFALAVYFMRRFGVMPVSGGGDLLRIERVVSLGHRSRLAVVRAGDRRLLLGITPGSIRRLADLGPASGAESGSDDAA
jgi:flagellar biosynthetic protein FliO